MFVTIGHQPYVYASETHTELELRTPVALEVVITSTSEQIAFNLHNRQLLVMD